MKKQTQNAVLDSQEVVRPVSTQSQYSQENPQQQIQASTVVQNAEETKSQSMGNSNGNQTPNSKQDKSVLQQSQQNPISQSQINLGSEGNQLTIQKLNESLYKLVVEIEKLRLVIIAKDKQLQDINNEKQILQNQLNEFNNSQVTRDNQEYQILQNKHKEMLLIHEEEVQNLKKQVEGLSSVNKSYEDQLNLTNNDLKTSQKNQNQMNQHVSQNIQILTTEIQKLNAAMKAKDEEIEKIAFEKQQDKSEIERLQNLNKNLVIETDRYKEVVRNLQSNPTSNQEVTILRNQLEEWKVKYSVLERNQESQKDAKIRALLDENQSLRTAQPKQESQSVQQQQAVEQDLRTRLQQSYSLIDELKKQILENTSSINYDEKPSQPPANNYYNTGKGFSLGQQQQKQD